MEIAAATAFAIAVAAALVAMYAKGRVDGLNDAFVAMDEAMLEGPCYREKGE